MRRFQRNIQTFAENIRKFAAKFQKICPKKPGTLNRSLRREPRGRAGLGREVLGLDLLPLPGAEDHLPAPVREGRERANLALQIHEILRKCLISARKKKKTVQGVEKLT